jgi:glycosyltransferase involved in cell wall biosynthesis
LIHDEFKHWKNLAIDAFKRINATSKIDFVISTYPVVAPHLAALQLKKEGFEFKWIADMRDEMSLNPYNNYLKKKYLKKVEHELFSCVNTIITVTPSLVSVFKKLAGDKVPVEEIRNGYDFEITDDYNYNKIFTITHTGTFYADIKPYSFLNAIGSLLSENKLPEIKVIFIGAGNTVSIPGNLKNIVSSTPKIPHKLAELRIKESDANLLLIPKSISDSLPGKLYEYIASQKPVIALAEKNSEAANLLIESNAGFIANFNDTDQIKNHILEIFELWKARKRLHINIGYFKQYHRKEQVKKLEKLILEKL